MLSPASGTSAGIRIHVSRPSYRSAPVHQDVIPEDLKRRRAWMGTRFVPRKDGKVDKPPYRVRSGLPVVQASKTNPENWSTFDEAREALQHGDVDAIGFVFTGADPYTVIDLDGVIDRETGEISARAAEIVGAFPTYWETSTSGEGLHGVCVGSKPGKQCKKDPVEIYDGRSGARFVVLTGRALSGEGEVRDCSEQVHALYRDLFTSEAPTEAPRHGERQRTAAPPLGREELLKKARRSKTGATFLKLFDQGDVSGFKSPSEADYALINALIFWTGGSEERVVELFEYSALYRQPPEKDRGYVARSVARALASYTGDFYRPRRPDVNTTPEADSPLAPYLGLLLDPSAWTGRKGPGAFKAYTALISLAVERGIETDSGTLRIGASVRDLAERSGIERATLCKSTLPYLITEQRRITWKRCPGKNAGEFVLLTPRDTTKECGYFSGVAPSEILEVLKQLIRMRTGRARFAEVARLGPLAMFCFVAMATTQRGIDLAELVRRTGRRKDNLRRKMRELEEVGVVRVEGKDRYALPLDFWQRYELELERSGIVESEENQRRRHTYERIMREEDWRRRQRGERGEVVKMRPGTGKARRRNRPETPRSEPGEGSGEHGAKVVPIALRHQETRSRREHRRLDDVLKPAEAALQDEYDRMAERCQARLAANAAAQEKRRRERWEARGKAYSRA